MSIPCPSCHSDRVSVLQTRRREYGTARRYLCRACSSRFSTEETYRQDQTERETQVRERKKQIILRLEAMLTELKKDYRNDYNLDSDSPQPISDRNTVRYSDAS